MHAGIVEHHDGEGIGVFLGHKLIKCFDDCLGKCLRLSFRALRGNEIMQLRKIHAFFLLSRHLVTGSVEVW